MPSEDLPALDEGFAGEPAGLGLHDGGDAVLFLHVGVVRVEELFVAAVPFEVHLGADLLVDDGLGEERD